MTEARPVLEIPQLLDVISDFRDRTILNNRLMYDIPVGSAEYNACVWGAVEDAFASQGVEPAFVRSAFGKDFQIPGMVSDAPYSMDNLLDLFRTARDRVEGDHTLINDTPVDSDDFRTRAWELISETTAIHGVDDSFLKALGAVCNVPAPAPERSPGR